MYIKFEGICNIPDIMLEFRNKQEIVNSCGEIIYNNLIKNIFLEKLTVYPVKQEIQYIPDYEVEEEEKEEEEEIKDGYDSDDWIIEDYLDDIEDIEDTDEYGELLG